ncbi:MAG: tetratricopeptide repeat protein [Bacteroidetes bacterium]|nr:tetratricopeptide repeat protein [Bacteroidota bacterium]
MTTFLRKAILLASVLYTQLAFAQTASEGLTAMQLEDWDKAISVYTALSKSNPADQQALLNLGNAFLAKGNKEEALKAFQGAYTAKPEGALAYIANGRVMLIQDNQTEADNQFKKAAKSGKKDVNALRLIGESYLFYIAPGSKRANLTRAEELLKVANELNSKDYNTLMSLGYCYKEMPNGGLAAQNYEFAEQQEQSNPLPKLMLAKVYKAAKLSDKFLLNIDRAISVAPNNALVLREKALFLYFARKWEDATKAYKTLVANGDHVTIEDEMQLANCLFITKDCKGCSELVEKILKKDGTKNYLRRLQAYCDYENGSYQQGLNILNDYFKIVTPDKILASDYEYRGKLLVKTKGDTLAATNDFQKAISMDTSRWKDLYLEISNLMYAKKDYCGAASAYKFYLDSVPQPKATDYYNLGLRQYYCKDDSLRYVHALASFNKVTEMMPDKAIGWLWVAKANAKLDPDVEQHPELVGEFGKAHEAFEKYVSIASADKVKNKKDLIAAYEYLTYYHYNKNEVPEVTDLAGKLLEIDPNNQTATELLKAVQTGTPGTTPLTPTPNINGGGNKSN